MRLTKQIQRKQKELKQLSRDMKYAHGKSCIGEAQIRIENLRDEIRELGEQIRSEEEGL